MSHKKIFPLILGCLTFLMSTLLCLGNEMSQTTTATGEEKIVYLTFDDGPVPKITERLLDILKQEEVPATFFVVGKEIIGREAILQRIYQEGHSIGLHSYTHNFSHVYASPYNFIEEMEQTEKKINEVLNTSLDIKVIRFPGGSARRLTKAFLAQLENEGYKIFDWNIDLQDGIHPYLSAEALYKNALKCEDKSNRKFILAHCNSVNHTTCDALADIIRYYKKEGYVFKKIDNDTPSHYFPVRK